jgi:hypothetical protein
MMHQQHPHPLAPDSGEQSCALIAEHVPMNL